MAKSRRIAASKSKKSSEETKYAHLFKKTPRDFNIGRSIQPKKNLSRFVKWPRYIRVQRQRAILKHRLRVPPAVNQFTNTIDKNQAMTLFKLLAKYRPESKKEKQERLKKIADDKVKNKKADKKEKPKVLKYGLNHITNLVESRKASLVVIAHDVDPLELVIWLPTLCRKMKVPFCIVKGKARLGALCHQKTCTAVALTNVEKQDERALQQFVASVEPMYEEAPRTWGAVGFGLKSQHKIRAREREIEKERAKRFG
mmetsp:Transcript_23199/g.32404  ORF Transcript_23199/g.32404 Transcript_23199/m.32404 type:complete len:256 (+) Transcript_23199:21-788(+)